MPLPSRLLPHPPFSPPDAGIAAGGVKAQLDTVYQQTYPVKDLLAKIRKERGLSEPAVKAFLKKQTERPWVTLVRGGSQRRDPSNVDWHGDQLVVGATAAGTQAACGDADAFRKFGTTEIVIDVRFLTIGDQVFQELLPEWTMSPLNVDEAGLTNFDAVEPAAFDRPLGSHEGACVTRAQLSIERDSPTRFRVVDQEQGEKLIDRCQADKRSNILQAPKVTVFSGQTTLVSDTSYTPFVVGVKLVVGDFATANEPQIRVVSEGTMLHLRPVADRSGAVRLDFAATFSKIQDVETATFNRRTPTDGTTIQLPKVATVRLEGGAA